jgi:hypothetical protein
MSPGSLAHLARSGYLGTGGLGCATKWSQLIGMLILSREAAEAPVSQDQGRGRR